MYNTFYKMIFFPLFLLVFFAVGCGNDNNNNTTNSSVLFLDMVSTSKTIKTNIPDKFKLKKLTVENGWTSEGKNKKDIWPLSNQLKDLKKGILDINFSFKMREELPEKYRETMGSKEREDIYYQKLSKATLQKMLDNKSWSTLSGDWSFNSFIHGNIAKNNKNVPIDHLASGGVALYTPEKIRDGAISLKFKFLNKDATDSHYFGIGFRMDKKLSGNLLSFSKRGNIKFSTFKEGRYQAGVISADSNAERSALFRNNEVRVEIFFHDRKVKVFIVNKESTYALVLPDVTFQDGFIGFFTNTEVKVENPLYSRILLPKRENFLELNSKLIGLSIKPDGSFKLNKNGPDGGKDLSSGFLPFFHKNVLNKHSHNLQIVNKGQESSFFLNDVLLKKMNGTENLFSQMNFYTNDKSQVTISDISVLKAKGTDFTYSDLKNFRDIRRVKNNFKWRENERAPDIIMGKYKVPKDRPFAIRGILVNSPSEMKFPVQIPPDSFLNFGICLPEELKGKSEPVTFKIILVDSENNQNTIFSQELVDIDRNYQWLNFDMDLPNYAGFKGEIAFVTEAKDKEGGKLSRLGVWGEPGIFQRRTENEFNVILISIDTLRADQLGSYGATKNISPNIDSFAKEGTLFLNAYSQASWTLPSHLSLFTSLYPSVFLRESLSLSTPSLSIASILGKNGYIVHGVTGGGYVSSDLGFSHGFNAGYRSIAPIDEALNETNAWINIHNKDKFFIFFHTYEVHEYGNYGEHGKIETYQASIKSMDRYFGSFIEHLKKLNILNKTLIVLTSDHGEEFYEHGRTGHGHSLFNELLHIPLIFRFPGKIPQNIKIPYQVSSIDILPTILDMLKIKKSNLVTGKSLTDFFSGSENKNRMIFSETGNNMPTVKSSHLKTVREDDVKLILNDSGGTGAELYDIENDPGETINLYRKEKESDATKKLMDRAFLISKKNKNLNNKLESRAFSDGGITQETKERLKALGYLQ